jgi:hypothetical protein
LELLPVQPMPMMLMVLVAVRTVLLLQMAAVLHALRLPHRPLHLALRRTVSQHQPLLHHHFHHHFHHQE